MSFYHELDHLDLNQLIACFDQPIHPDGATYYQEVASRIRQQGDAGIDFLFGRMNKARTDQLRGVFLGLTFPPLQQHLLTHLLRQKLLDYLHDKRPLVVMDAIDALRMQAEDTALENVLALRNHASPYVRGAVLRFVSKLRPELAPELLIHSLRDPHYRVRENGIDELDDLGITDSLPYVRPLLHDRHPDVQQAAETAVAHLEAKILAETVEHL